MDKILVLLLAAIISASGCISAQDTALSSEEIESSLEEDIRWAAVNNIEHFDRVNEVNVVLDDEEVAGYSPEESGVDNFRYIYVDLVLDGNHIDDDFEAAQESAVKLIPTALETHESVMSVNVFVSKIETQRGDPEIRDLGSIVFTRPEAAEIEGELNPENLDEQRIELNEDKPLRNESELVRTDNFDRDEEYEELIEDYTSNLYGFTEDTEASYELLSSDVREQVDYTDYHGSITSVKSGLEAQGVTFDLLNVETLDENINSAVVEVTAEMSIPGGTATPSTDVSLLLEEDGWKIDENWNPFNIGDPGSSRDEDLGVGSEDGDFGQRW